MAGLRVVCRVTGRHEWTAMVAADGKPNVECARCGQRRRVTRDRYPGSHRGGPSDGTSFTGPPGNHGFPGGVGGGGL
jgi:hypothetical protein